MGYSARQNQQQSPLLRLPPELRNKIYGYVLGGKVFQFRSEKYHELVKSSMKKKQNLALLGVCRQVYAETALLPFTLSTFSIRYVKTWHKWLADIKTARAANIKFVQCQMTQVGSVVWTPYERWSSRTLVDLVSPHLKLRELPLLKHIEITIELFSFTSFARGDAETKAHAVESAKSLNRAIQVQRPDVTIEIWIKEEEFQELVSRSLSLLHIEHGKFIQIHRERINH